MEKIGDMILLEKTEYKHNHQYYKIKCSICGKEREVSKVNLMKRGNKHSISSCKSNYVMHDLLHKSFGDYVVVGVGNKNKIKMQCKICGHTYDVYESNLTERYHNASTCKNDFYEHLINKKIEDVEVIGVEKNYINCRCSICGTVRRITKQTFFSKNELSHETCIKFLPNDDIKRTLESRWSCINQRINNPNNTNYQNYGGRGIKNEFKDFVDFYYYFYDALKKDKFLTIDRIDVNGNYSKENTRLISHKEQQSNKQNTNYFIARKDDLIVISNNAMEFGKQFDLNGRSVGNCLRGKSKSSGGWTFEKIEKDVFLKIVNDDSPIIIKCLKGE